jgi:hypothetical protein
VWTLTPEDMRTPREEGELYRREIDIVEDGDVHSCAITVCASSQEIADERAMLILAAAARRPRRGAS